MFVIVNGEPRPLPEPQTLTALLKASLDGCPHLSRIVRESA